MSDGFVGPSSPSGLDLKLLLGGLLLITVHEVEPHVPTVHTKPGEKSPAVRCDIAVLDGPNKGEEFVDTLIFPRVLQRQLKGNVGKRVLGRLEQGVAKPGQSPPWRLSDQVTAKERKLGNAYLESETANATASGGDSDGDDEPPF